VGRVKWRTIKHTSSLRESIRKLVNPRIEVSPSKQWWLNMEDLRRCSRSLKRNTTSHIRHMMHGITIDRITTRRKKINQRRFILYHRRYRDRNSPNSYVHIRNISPIRNCLGVRTTQMVPTKWIVEGSQTNSTWRGASQRSGSRYERSKDRKMLNTTHNMCSWDTWARHSLNNRITNQRCSIGCRCGEYWWSKGVHKRPWLIMHQWMVMF